VQGGQLRGTLVNDDERGLKIIGRRVMNERCGIPFTRGMGMGGKSGGGGGGWGEGGGGWNCRVEDGWVLLKIVGAKNFKSVAAAPHRPPALSPPPLPFLACAATAEPPSRLLAL